MILEGAVCEVCGVFFEDEPPGFPRSCGGCSNGNGMHGSRRSKTAKALARKHWEEEVMPRLPDQVKIIKQNDYNTVFEYKGERMTFYPASNKIQRHKNARWYPHGLEYIESLIEKYQ